jgi:hypothetical protein
MSNNPLPKPFRAWQPWLSWFDENLQPIVADLLLQLNNLLGPTKESRWKDQQFLSGLGDLKKRGSYDHLLTSEWLIAEEEPDEFIRRAVSYEHLFFTPMQEKSKANGVIIALFDCGILQLGVSRLVHLILMLLLEIRSHNHQSQFYWGIIQNRPNLRLFKDIGDLKCLLNKRTTTLATDKMYRHWANYFEQSEQLYDECWLIGANPPFTTFSTHQVNIERLIKSPEKLSVTINSKIMSKHCCLSLPAPIFCEKMLAGQFASNSDYAEIIQQSVVPINIGFNPIISANGKCILTLNLDSTMAYCINITGIHSPKKNCRIQYHHLSGSVLGMDLKGKRIVALLHDQQRLFLWQANSGRFELVENLNIDKDKPLIAFLGLYNVHGSTFLFIDSNSLLCSLYFLPKKNEVISLQTINKNVVALFKLHDSAAYYFYFDDQNRLCLTGYNAGTYTYRLVGIKHKSNLQYLLTAEQLWLKGFGRLAIGDGQLWRVFTAEKESMHVTVPNEWLVFGLFYDSYDGRTHFLVINHDKKQVALFDYVTNSINICLRSPHKIVSYSYNSLAKSFTVTTDAGELILYSFITQSMRLKLSKID